MGITSKQLEDYLRKAVEPDVLKNVSPEKLAEGIQGMLSNLNGQSAEVESKKGRGI